MVHRAHSPELFMLEWWTDELTRGLPKDLFLFLKGNSWMNPSPRPADGSKHWAGVVQRNQPVYVLRCRPGWRGSFNSLCIVTCFNIRRGSVSLATGSVKVPSLAFRPSPEPSLPHFLSLACTKLQSVYVTPCNPPAPNTLMFTSQKFHLWMTWNAVMLSHLSSIWINKKI